MKQDRAVGQLLSVWDWQKGRLTILTVALHCQQQISVDNGCIYMHVISGPKYTCYMEDVLEQMCQKTHMHAYSI